MISESDRELTREYCRRLKAIGIEPYRVIVYGSRARGDAREDSDLDLLIILEDMDLDVKSRADHVAWELGFERDILILPRFMLRDEVENSPVRSSFFMLNVNREVVVL